MINFYTIRNELEDSGWVLLSEVYKNLSTPIKMKCPEGHIQEKSYGEWRKRPICDVCLIGGSRQKKKTNGIPPKQEGVRRILALDAATVDSGYAVYDDKKLVSFGVHHCTKSYDTTARINEFKKWLIQAINDWKPDFLGVEHIQLQGYAGGLQQVEVYRVLANLQGVIMDTAFELNLPAGLVRPSEWRKYCGISGGDQHRENKKKLAQEKVKSWYGVNCTQDEADAICIGKFFVHTTHAPVVMWGENLYD